MVVCNTQIKERAGVTFDVYTALVQKFCAFYVAFLFNTYLGPGVDDPELEVLKLDYDNDANPSFLIRTVLDELVQVSGDYYLGKAFMKMRKVYKLVAFFALRRY